MIVSVIRIRYDVANIRISTLFI